MSHSHQWFAIAAFPLIAGTFGPVATAMNICALGQPWRRTIIADGQPPKLGDSFPDPKWYFTLLSF
jgi:potassium channel subfamily K